jgi:hypothetical protein
VLTVLVQVPDADALAQLTDDLPAFVAAAERAGCAVSLIDEDGRLTELPEERHEDRDQPR